MLRRVARGGSRRHHDEPQSPFEVPTDGRPLRLVLDFTTAPPGEALDVLRSFGHHPSVEILEYHGVPAGREVRAMPEPREGPAELRLGDAEHDTGWITVEVLGDRRVTRTTAGEQQVLRNIAAEYGAQRVDDATRALALCWATDSLGYDALVTGSPAVLGQIHENLVARGNPVSPTVGCELLGLFLRARDDYTIEMGDSHSGTCNRSTFFDVLTRELLPASWRWLSACMHYWIENSASDLGGLGMSGIERFDRALRARDRLNIMRQLGDRADVVEEEIFAFDVLLLMLSAAFDVTAMVATRAYGLAVKDQNAGWKRDGWRRALRSADRALFDRTAPGSPTRDAMDAVAHMRNMVHGETLRPEFHWNRWPRQHRVRVPDGVAAKLTKVAQRQGGLEAFGLDDDARGVYVDPSVYGATALALAADALNDLMAATKVERLVRDPSVLLEGPPAREPGMGVWDDEWHRARYRLLAGL